MQRRVWRCRRFWAVAALLLPACELQEVTLAEGDDIVVVEIVLRAEEPVQLAFLHRTRTTDSATVPGAVVEVRDAQTGGRLTFGPVSETQCLDFENERPGQPLGSCYRSNPGGPAIRPGARYTLQVTLPDGGVITGETTVPGSFALNRPASNPCRLAVDSTVEFVWTRADSAWAYLAETRLAGLRDALRRRNIPIGGNGPVRLIGLSVGREDTTLAFPREFGVFDRADPDLTDALVAIQNGLPADVFGAIVVAATDRNYVNWVRGGNFNPSGQVRVASVRGDGTGVFGSLVPRTQNLSTSATDTSPACTRIP
jgi:hypothetical protein